MLPKLTHLQFCVLTILLNSELSGREVRERLKKDFKEKRSLASFYQLMSRLEESGMIEGHYKTTSIVGQGIRTRYYKIIGHGVRAWEQTRDFYAAAAKVQPGVV